MRAGARATRLEAAASSRRATRWATWLPGRPAKEAASRSCPSSAVSRSSAWAHSWSPRGQASPRSGDADARTARPEATGPARRHPARAARRHPQDQRAGARLRGRPVRRRGRPRSSRSARLAAKAEGEGGVRAAASSSTTATPETAEQKRAMTAPDHRAVRGRGCRARRAGARRSSELPAARAATRTAGARAGRRRPRRAPPRPHRRRRGNRRRPGDAVRRARDRVGHGIGRPGATSCSASPSDRDRAGAHRARRPSGRSGEAAIAVRTAQQAGRARSGQLLSGDRQARRRPPGAAAASSPPPSTTRAPTSPRRGRPRIGPAIAAEALRTRDRRCRTRPRRRGDGRAIHATALAAVDRANAAPERRTRGGLRDRQAGIERASRAARHARSVEARAARSAPRRTTSPPGAGRIGDARRAPASQRGRAQAADPGAVPRGHRSGRALSAAQQTALELCAAAALERRAARRERVRTAGPSADTPASSSGGGSDSAGPCSAASSGGLLDGGGSSGSSWSGGGWGGSSPGGASAERTVPRPGGRLVGGRPRTISRSSGRRGGGGRF